jgi:hypothetical protein
LAHCRVESRAPAAAGGDVSEEWRRATGDVALVGRHTRNDR